jgi:hypothetical protein
MVASDVLAGRLCAGETLIDAKTDTERRLELEGFWIHLLHDYERSVAREHRDQDERRAFMRAGR